MDTSGLQPYTSRLVARNGGLHPPPEVMLSWPKPNHIDPEERGWEAPIALLVLQGVTTLVYVARMWARLFLSKNAGLDDLLISLAMLPLFGLTISTVLGIRIYGFQWHVWDQTATTLVTAREASNISIAMAIELNYMVSTTLIKVSILCFYRRITGRLTTQFVYWVWGCIIFCVVYGVVFTFAIIFTCTPVVGFFHIFDIMWRLKNEVTCRNEGAIIVACAAVSSIQDFIICMLPIFLIWNLHISKRQKVGLCGIFGVGIITCVCGILRTYYATYLYYFTYDITWTAYYGWVWTTLEAQLAVICASAPALKVFFRRYFAQYTSRAGYTAPSSGYKTPGLSSFKSFKSPLHTHNSKRSQGSAQRSQCTAGGILGSDVPLDRIKVSQGLDVRVEERDDLSRVSFGSTHGLTALPMPKQPGWTGRSEWVEGCRTVCAALRPGSRGTSRSRSREGDVETGPPF
ncbi:hypothetical protein BDW02DRAFT_504756 [Decorospora gaudefroyi]|uniref:Rhodopsin domain-containing protein n=1 Tax=Decorospora gaudefroyi TaxID=184978 RepID=A0A6A5K4M6_9PLEO|nr:hypothetical protein BDW02DRAFT_504756 [Decorospora gaudefroyi]